MQPERSSTELENRIADLALEYEDLIDELSIIGENAATAAVLNATKGTLKGKTRAKFFWLLISNADRLRKRRDRRGRPNEA